MHGRPLPGPLRRTVSEGQTAGVGKGQAKARDACLGCQGRMHRQAHHSAQAQLQCIAGEAGRPFLGGRGKEGRQEGPGRRQHIGSLASTLVALHAPTSHPHLVPRVHTCAPACMRQGSNRLEHWSINFRFEPTPFEDDPSLLVHRGMYEAAKVWNCMMPLHTSVPCTT